MDTSTLVGQILYAALTRRWRRAPALPPEEFADALAWCERWLLAKYGRDLPTDRAGALRAATAAAATYLNQRRRSAGKGKSPP